MAVRKRRKKATAAKVEKVVEPVEAAAPVEAAEPVEAAAPAEPVVVAEPEPVEVQEYLPEPRRSVAFIGSECYPFVKTGGLGDVMYALPKALTKLNCDVKVILPKYACIKPEYQEKMVYRGSFNMDLCSDGRQFYVGIMEYVWDGVVYDFIDNEEFFGSGNPYTNLVDDIPKFCYFGKAALAALNYMDWIPDVIHCHDWQAGLVPIYLRTMFNGTQLARSKVVTTIHNLRFQGKYNIPTIKYWSNLPDEAFNMGALQEEWTEANMLKGGLAYSDMITTVSGTYAGEIQTWEYGEGLDAHLRHHSGKLRGIVNGIDVDIWNPATDKLIEAPYDTGNAIENKKANKMAVQRALGLEENPDKFMIGLISRLTNQKGLDLVSSVAPGLIDGFSQVVILGTGDAEYENAFRGLENAHKGEFCAYIAYDEALSHQIYAASDVLLVPSKFEPCGLTQLIAMRYGTAPVVRETGGLKDTVEPYNMFENTGNGFTFDRYEAGLLWDAINRAKTLYFEDRADWDKMVIRNMEKDVSWAKSAEQYRNLYVEITQ
jgi:starch synthase